MTTKPKTRKAPAAASRINPKLIALAAKADAAETELKRVLDDVVEPADLRLFANREDKAAQSAHDEANATEARPRRQRGGGREIKQRPRHEFGGTDFEGSPRDVDFLDDVVALSIIRDLRAFGRSGKGPTCSPRLTASAFAIAS